MSETLPTLTQGDLLQVLDPDAVELGEGLFLGGQVIDVRWDPEEGYLHGQVRSSSGEIHEQQILIDREDGEILIDGECSCDDFHNCRHVAAVIWKQMAGTAGASPVPGGDADGEEEPSDIPSPQLMEWLTRIAGTSRAKVIEGSRFVDDWTPAESALDPEAGAPRDRLVYLLTEADAVNGAAGASIPLRLTCHVTKIGKGGKPGKRRDVYRADDYDPENPPPFLIGKDGEILEEMAALIPSMGNRAVPASGDGAALLEAVVATGRCWWGSLDGKPLALDAPVEGELKWKKEKEAKHQWLKVKLPSKGILCRAAPPFVIEERNAKLRPVDLPLPDDLSALLLDVPPVRAADIPGVSHALEKLGHDLPLPKGKVKAKLIDAAPIPCLTLQTATLTRKRAAFAFDTERGPDKLDKFPLQTVCFDYGGHMIPHETQGIELRIEDEKSGKLIIIPRDMDAEKQYLASLRNGGVRDVAHYRDWGRPGDAEHGFVVTRAMEAAVHGALKAAEEIHILYSQDVVTRLDGTGWRVDFTEDYPYRLAEGAVEWWAEADESKGGDWFTVVMGVSFEGQRIDIMPTLATVIQDLPGDRLSKLAGENGELEELMEGKMVHHRLPDGRLLPLPASSLVPVVRSLLGILGPRAAHSDALDEDGIKLDAAAPHAVAQLMQSQALGNVSWSGDKLDQVAKLGRVLTGEEPLTEIEPPPEFNAELREYQMGGLNWLNTLRETGFGGVLADDMGLGKTVQALAFICHEKDIGRLTKPVLIVAPTSVLPNWQAEVRNFAPHLKVLILHGKKRHEHFDDIETADIVLTTYPLIGRDADVLVKKEFHAMFLDEAQAIKNPKSVAALTCRMLKAEHRFALTGTPLENNLDEVWSLFAVISPGLLGDRSTFRTEFRNPIEKEQDTDAQEILTKRLKPFMLRRTKDLVAKELPPKTEIIEHIALGDDQIQLYEAIRATMHDRVREAITARGLSGSRITILDALLKLRQVCCDPRLLKSLTGEPPSSAKLERLMEMIPALISEGRQILLFSQFTSMLSLIEEELKKQEIKYEILTGQTRDRRKPVENFQAGKSPLFLISLKAGGTGLNLTAADTVIHYDPWWNPAVEAQATDRAHRLGQDKPVFVHKMVVEDSVEEGIMALKAKKAALADALFAAGGDSPLDLDEATLEALFAPIGSTR
ncbi:MAG: hypothetical protein Alpg2KO_12460 [Alphaproteobacteria bacterium]